MGFRVATRMGGLSGMLAHVVGGSLEAPIELNSNVFVRLPSYSTTQWG